MFTFLILPLFYLLFRKEVCWYVVLYSNTGCPFEGLEVCETLCLDEMQIFLGVEILLIFGLEVQLVVASVKFIEVIHGYVIIEFLIQAYACLIGPTPRHIFYGISSSTQDKKWKVPRFDEFHTISMPSDCSIIVAKAIIGEGISSTLNDYRVWSESLSHIFHYLKRVNSENSSRFWRDDSKIHHRCLGSRGHSVHSADLLRDQCPWHRLCLERNLHICGMRLSWLCLCSRMPLRLRHRDVHQCRCRVLGCDTWATRELQARYHWHSRTHWLPSSWHDAVHLCNQRENCLLTCPINANICTFMIEFDSCI